MNYAMATTEKPIILGMTRRLVLQFCLRGLTGREPAPVSQSLNGLDLMQLKDRQTSGAILEQARQTLASHPGLRGDFA
jgi:hypothetical protein